MEHRRRDGTGTGPGIDVARNTETRPAGEQVAVAFCLRGILGLDLCPRQLTVRAYLDFTGHSASETCIKTTKFKGN